MLIDIHSHCWHKAVLRLEGQKPVPVPETLLAAYDRLGVDKGCILPLIGPECTCSPNSNEDMLEIAARYPVDGIHFDDYFYLYQDVGGADHAAFQRHNPRRLPLAQWRRENVTQVIRGVHEELRKLRSQNGRRISFGVSPFGIWANREHLAVGSLTGGKESYFVQYADTRGWIKAGYLDYIAPQLYWPFSHETAAYAALVDWWSDTVRGTRTKLYVGHGFYQVGKPGWKAGEIENQLRYDQLRSEVSGSIFFSARHLLRPDNPVKRSAVERLRRLWGR